MAALLIAAAHVLRPLQVHYTPPVTAERCAWNRPNPGDAYNYLRPVCYIPFTHEDINNVDKKQSQSCQQSSLGRGAYNPFPPHVRLRTRDDPLVRDALRALYEHLQETDDGKKKCAAEVQWPPDYRGNQDDSDSAMSSLEEARRWSVLPGDYLADKGFLIHSMLARHSAGLYKPPHRRRGQAQLTPDEVVTTRRVANMRIHVEREMRRGREFHIMNNTLSISHVDMASAEAFVCFMLGNLQAPLIGQDFNDDAFKN